MTTSAPPQPRTTGTRGPRVAAPAPGPARSTMRLCGDTAARITVLGAATGAWEAAARHTANPFFPAPTTIAAWIHRHWFTGPVSHLYLGQEFQHHAGASIGRLLAGWATAAVLGTVLGLLLGRSALAHDLTNPIVQFGRSVPPVVLIPVFFTLLPAGTPMQVMLIASGALWPVLLNTIAGARAIPPGLLDAVAVLHIGPGDRIRRVLLPAAAPAIFTGLRISFSIALILMVVSELYAATDGIGYALIGAQQSFDLPAMWAWIVLLAVLGNAGNAALAAATRRVLARHGRTDHPEAKR